MKQSKRWLKGAGSLCEEIGAEDGIAPRFLHRSSTMEKSGYKNRQLCKTARHTLSLVLGGEFSDPMLQSLSVVDVASNDEGASLLVSLGYIDDGSARHAAQILESLHAVQGVLRSALARSVNRKRVPALRFKLVRADSEESSHACS
jgi:ribosome-binding factor A